MRLMAGFFVLVAIACANEKKSSVEIPPIDPPKVLNVGFVVVDSVYNSELIAPMDVFHHTKFHTTKGMNVFTIASQRKPISTFEGLTIVPDFSFETDSLPAIDVLVVPSAKHSMGADLQNEALIRFVAKAGHRASYVLSLCDGAFVLAKANLLQTYECTTFPDDVARFRKDFPKLIVHEDVSFVHDRKMITSIGGVKSYEAALYLTQLLYGKKVADRIAHGLVIDWQLEHVKYVNTGR